MSQPTPGSDPNYPQGGAPQGQPGWGAPQSQPQGYGAPQGYNAPGAPSGYGNAVARPSQVTAAAIIGIVIGGLGSLFGLISLFGIGLAMSGMTDRRPCGDAEIATPRRAKNAHPDETEHMAYSRR